MDTVPIMADNQPWRQPVSSGAGITSHPATTGISQILSPNFNPDFIRDNSLNSTAAVQQSDVSSSAPSLANEILGPLLLEAIDGFLFVVDAQGKVEFVTENIQDFTRYKQRDLIGKSIYNCIHVGDHAVFSSNLVPLSLASGSWPDVSNNKNRQIFKCRMLIKNDGIENNEKGLKTSHAEYENMQISATLQPAYPTENILHEIETKSCLVCIVRRLRMNDSNTVVASNNNMMLGVEQFTTKSDLNGTIVAFDSSGLPNNVYRCRDLVGQNIQELCHANDGQLLSKHHQEVLKMRSARSGVYRFKLQENRYAFVQTQSELMTNIHTNEPDFIWSSHSIIRECDSDIELKGSASTSLMKSIIQSNAANQPMLAPPSSGMAAAVKGYVNKCYNEHRRSSSDLSNFSSNSGSVSDLLQNSCWDDSVFGNSSGMSASSGQSLTISRPRLMNASTVTFNGPRSSCSFDQSPLSALYAGSPSSKTTQNGFMSPPQQSSAYMQQSPHLTPINPAMVPPSPGGYALQSHNRKTNRSGSNFAGMISNMGQMGGASVMSPNASGQSTCSSLSSDDGTFKFDMPIAMPNNNKNSHTSQLQVKTGDWQSNQRSAGIGLKPETIENLRLQSAAKAFRGLNKKQLIQLYRQRQQQQQQRGSSSSTSSQGLHELLESTQKSNTAVTVSSYTSPGDTQVQSPTPGPGVSPSEQPGSTSTEMTNSNIDSTTEGMLLSEVDEKNNNDDDNKNVLLKKLLEDDSEGSVDDTAADREVGTSSEKGNHLIMLLLNEDKTDNDSNAQNTSLLSKLLNDDESSPIKAGGQASNSVDITSPTVSSSANTVNTSDLQLMNILDDQSVTTTTANSKPVSMDDQFLATFLSQLWESQTERDQQRSSNATSASTKRPTKRKASVDDFVDSTNDLDSYAEKTNERNESSGVKRNYLLSQLLEEKSTAQDLMSSKASMAATAYQLPQAKLPKNLKDRIKDTPRPEYSNSNGVDKMRATSASRMFNARDNPLTNPNNPFPGNTNVIPTSGISQDISQGQLLDTSQLAVIGNSEMTFGKDPLLQSVLQTASDMQDSIAANSVNTAQTDNSQLFTDSDISISDIENILMDMSSGVSSVAMSSPHKPGDMNEQLEIERIEKQLLSDIPDLDPGFPVMVSGVGSSSATDLPSSLGIANIANSVPGTDRMMQNVHQRGAVGNQGFTLGTVSSGSFNQQRPTFQSGFQQNMRSSGNFRGQDANIVRENILKQKKRQLLQQQMAQMRYSQDGMNTSGNGGMNTSGNGGMNTSGNGGMNTGGNGGMNTSGNGGMNTGGNGDGSGSNFPVESLNDLLNSGMAPNVTIQRNHGGPSGASSSINSINQVMGHSKPEYSVNQQHWNQMPNNLPSDQFQMMQRQQQNLTQTSSQFQQRGPGLQYQQQQQQQLIHQRQLQQTRLAQRQASLNMPAMSTTSALNMYGQAAEKLPAYHQDMSPGAGSGNPQPPFNQTSLPSSDAFNAMHDTGNWAASQNLYNMTPAPESIKPAGNVRQQMGPGPGLGPGPSSSSGTGPSTTSQMIRQEIRAMCNARSSQSQQQDTSAQYSSDEIPMELINEIDELTNMKTQQDIKHQKVSPGQQSQPESQTDMNAYGWLSEQEIMVKQRQEAKQRYEQFCALSTGEIGPEMVASNLFRNQLGSVSSSDNTTDNMNVPTSSSQETVSIVQTEPRPSIDDIKPANQKNSLLQQLLSD